MNRLRILLFFLLVCTITTSSLAAEHSGLLQLKQGIQQPYVVKRGDTLWDIANHFFQDPHQWLKIWEHNLSITNPDLIYPGNKIWFDSNAAAKSGGLSTVHPHPQIVIKPVEREKVALDQSLVLGALARQDMIAPDAVQGMGYVLDARDGRLHFATGDEVYLHLDRAAASGDVFDVFRPGEPVTAAGSDKTIGVLILHLGQLQILSQSGDIYRARVVRAFEEISRGDFLMPARKVTARITPSLPDRQVQGQVIHIRDNAVEAGQNQVVAIDIGAKDGVHQGTELHVYQKGRKVKGRDGETMVQLPSERIATLVVISPQQVGSLALVTQSSTSINIGDEVRGTPHP